MNILLPCTKYIYISNSFASSRTVGKNYFKTGGIILFLVIKKKKYFNHETQLFCLLLNHLISKFVNNYTSWGIY